MTFTAPNGVLWGVQVDLPGSSNAMVIFRHPDGRTSRKDRYNWYISRGPEARSVTTLPAVAPSRITARTLRASTSSSPTS